MFQPALLIPALKGMWLDSYVAFMFSKLLKVDANCILSLSSYCIFCYVQMLLPHSFVYM